MIAVDRLRRRRHAPVDEAVAEVPPANLTEETVPIAEVRWRERARVAGRVRSLRVRPWGDAPTLECVLVDDTGGLVVVFLGRRKVAGIRPGTRLVVEGTVGSRDGHPAIVNPEYDFVGSVL